MEARTGLDYDERHVEVESGLDSKDPIVEWRVARHFEKWREDMIIPIPTRNKMAGDSRPQQQQQTIKAAEGRAKRR